MKHFIVWIVAIGVAGSGGSLWATEAHVSERTAPPEETLTGEVVALWCLLREGSFGTGRSNHAAQVHCIRLGSPIALKVGATFYLIATEDRRLRDRLTSLAGDQVTMQGMVEKHSGYAVITLSRVERVKEK